LGEESESGTSPRYSKFKRRKLRDEHFEVISENKARRYEKDKKELQHQVMDLEMALYKIKEVIKDHEKSNDNK